MTTTRDQGRPSYKTTAEARAGVGGLGCVWQGGCPMYSAQADSRFGCPWDFTPLVSKGRKCKPLLSSEIRPSSRAGCWNLSACLQWVLVVLVPCPDQRSQPCARVTRGGHDRMVDDAQDPGEGRKEARSLDQKSKHQRQWEPAQEERRKRIHTPRTRSLPEPCHFRSGCGPDPHARRPLT